MCEKHIQFVCTIVLTCLWSTKVTIMHNLNFKFIIRLQYFQQNNYTLIMMSFETFHFISELFYTRTVNLKNKNILYV